MSNKMNKEIDNLDKLWQQQHTSAVDIKALTRQWKLMRLKQFLYSIMDGLALLAIPVVVYTVPKELSTFEFIWMSSLFVLMTGWFMLMLWLRRFSLGLSGAGESTQNYVDNVKTQYRQNIRIAYLNKVFCYITPFIFLSYIVIAYIGEFVSAEVLWKKGLICLGTSIVFLPLCYIWANKREQKFKQLLADFDTRWGA